MELVTLEWSNTVIDFSKISSNLTNKYLDDNGFYAVLTGKYDKNTNEYRDILLHYIGQAFDQTIRERAPQKHPAYTQIKQYLKKHPGFVPLLMPGVVIKITQKKLTQELVDDIEECLIYDNQPVANTINKDSYTGRSIIITNTGGFYPLNKISQG
ncbi:hypothetical protein AGMMS50268_29700 [Spirochaetia bacterium]|nr:hypothetical protein AGMMS50268_29700 [Spirochaetia bacterium]